MRKHVADASKREEKQKWAIEKQRLRGTSFIDPAHEEFKLSMKNARTK